MCAKYLEYETKLIHLQLMRITPAYAGKTKSSSVKLFAHRDHPRRCGENYLFRFYMTPSEGSPPQVRGKLRYILNCEVEHRITPAGAGKTHRRCSVCERA